MSDPAVIIHKKHLKVDIDDLYNFCLEKKYALAVWREPGKTAQAVIDPGETLIGEIELESSRPGFLFHPYGNESGIHFIRSVASLKLKKDGYSWENDPESISDEFQPQRNAVTSNKVVTKIVTDESAENKFVQLVENAKSAIGNGLFHKVVPSRCKELTISGLKIDRLFQNLTEKYPNAFVSVTFIPRVGLWIGASPEILVKTENNTFQTMALAGTQAYRPDVPISEISWTQKEIEEQAYVSRYIINCFKKIRLREFTELGPKSVVSGNLIHLKTSFHVDMNEVNFAQLGTVMMQLLHPTSAVCGMPRKEAERWLKENEGYEREYFSGFLGPVNIASDTALYVNLRCMKVLGDRIRLFAGAGVTEDSRPYKEWEETEIKMNTLLDVI